MSTHLANQILVTASRKTIVAFAIQFAGFATMTWILVYFSPGAYLSGIDGTYHRLNLMNQLTFGGGPHYFSSDPLQGLGGNIYFPYNSNLDLGFLIARLIGGYDLIWIVTIWAAILWCSIYALGSAIKLRSGVSFLSAWLSGVFITWPTIWSFDWGLLRNYSTNILLMAASTLLIATVFWIAKSIFAILAKLVIFYILFLYIVTLSPTSVILITPILLMFVFSLFFLQKPQVIAIRSVAVPLIGLFLIAVTGPGLFVSSLILNSAASVFGSSMQPLNREKNFASSLFSGQGQELGEVTYTLAFLVTVFFILLTVQNLKNRFASIYWKFLAGLVIGLVTLSGFHFGSLGLSSMSLLLCLLGLVKLSLDSMSLPTHRALGVSALIVALSIFLVAIFEGLFPEVYGTFPSPLYFEWYLWPVFCIGGASSFQAVRGALLDFLNKRFRFSKNWIGVRAIVLIVLVVVVVYYPRNQVSALLRRLHNPVAINHFAVDQLNVEGKMSEVERIIFESHLIPGSQLNGRFAMMFPVNYPDCCPEWDDFDEKLPTGNMSGMQMMTLSMLPLFEFGRDMQYTVPWSLKVPTLTEYSPLISSQSYLFLSETLAKSGDKQSRNILVLRKVNPKVIEMLGVKWLLTDAVIAGKSPIVSVEGKVSNRQNGSRFNQPKKVLILYLYEFEGANLQGWSPTAVSYSADISKTIDRVLSSDFNPKSNVIVDYESDDNSDLTQVIGQKLSLIKNGYKVRAESIGESILVLPIEYSNCWVWSSNEPEKEKSPKIVRANGVLVGLHFFGSIDGQITFRTGPYTMPGCKLKDRVDKD
jgi:hypothetical protein